MINHSPIHSPPENLPLIRRLLPTLTLLLGVIIFHEVCLSFDATLAELFKKYDVRYKDEYHVGEQLSKYYLFLIILVGLHHYQTSRDSKHAALGIAYFVGGLALYLGESNRITNDVQAVMAPLIIVSMLVCLIRTRLWTATAFMLLGFFLIAFAALADQAHGKHYFAEYFLSDELRMFWMRFPEESLEVKGAAFYFISAIIACRVSLAEILRKDIKGVVLLALAAAVLTNGNGWLHFQYTPRGIFLHIGLLTTWAGFAGILAVNKRFSSTYVPLKIINENTFRIFLLGLFVILPAMYRRHRQPVSYLIWLPVLLGFANALWRHRPQGETVEPS